MGLMLLRVAAAQAPGAASPSPIPPGDVDAVRVGQSATLRKPPLFADLDLMRRSEFSHAAAGMVSVRVQDGQGRAVAGLRPTDFVLKVNGTERPVRLRARGVASLKEHQPVVLLVFPPNQPTVHAIAVKDALRYFAAQGTGAGSLPMDPMPWRVGILDANGRFLPFTADRAELLRNLEAVAVAKEPLQFTGYRYLPRGESTWQQKADAAISNMAKSDGQRMIIAMNPLNESMYGLNETGSGAAIARESPADLVGVASRVGAHIYVDNAGGPEVLIPGGAASEGFGSQFAPQTLRQQARVLNGLAYTNSLMMQTAVDTMGGYANGLSDLGAQMERDLREAYVLEFDMTAEDEDTGVPEVEVRSPLKQIRLAMVDVAPLRVSPITETAVAARKTAELVLAAMRKDAKSVASADLRIHQRVDYFPVRGGMTPVLPMSGLVEWTGNGERPEELAIAESVLDLDLNEPVLERAIDTAWIARSVRWERAGELRAGHYAWMVAVHDGSGRVLASSRQRFTVDYKGWAAVAMSSLVTGSTCQTAPDPSGLQRRVARTDGRNPAVVLVVDPLRLADCRVIPEAADRFTAADRLRALVRIYPTGKLAKRAPEVWSAVYTLRGKDGLAEAVREGTFAVDSGSGLVASAEMALNGPGLRAGEHVLEVAVRGPGIRGVATEKRAVWVGVDRERR